MITVMIMAISVALPAWQAADAQEERPAPLVIAGVDAPESKRIFALLSQAYRDIGFDVRFEALPDLGSVAAVNRGKYDGEVARNLGIQQHFSHLVPVQQPVAQIALAVITHRDYQVTRQLLAKADHDSFVYQHKILLLQDWFRGSRAFEVSDARSMLTMLDSRRARIGVAIYGFVADQMGKFPFLRAREDLLAPIPLYHYVHERHGYLVPVLETALESLINNRGGILDLHGLPKN